MAAKNYTCLLLFRYFIWPWLDYPLTTYPSGVSQCEGARSSLRLSKLPTLSLRVSPATLQRKFQPLVAMIKFFHYPKLMTRWELDPPGTRDRVLPSGLAFLSPPQSNTMLASLWTANQSWRPGCAWNKLVCITCRLTASKLLIAVLNSHTQRQDEWHAITERSEMQ